VSLRLALFLLAVSAASGCASLADRIVDPHSIGQLDQRNGRQFERTLGITHAAWRTPQGVTLAYRIIPAAARVMTYDYARGTHGSSFHFSADMTAAEQAPTPPLRGTVVYLHGW
jgi:hypothetical protein